MNSKDQQALNKVYQSFVALPDAATNDSRGDRNLHLLIKPQILRKRIDKSMACIFLVKAPLEI